MSRKSMMLGLFLCLAISTLGFAKGKPATEPGDDRGGNNPGVGVDDNHNHRQRGKTPPATALVAKGKPATEPGDDRGGNNPGVGVDDNHNHRQRGKTPPPATA